MKKLISIILSVLLLVSILAVEASAALEPIKLKDDKGEELENEIDYQATLLQYRSISSRRSCMTLWISVQFRELCLVLQCRKLMIKLQRN